MRVSVRVKCMQWWRRRVAARVTRAWLGRTASSCKVRVRVKG